MQKDYHKNISKWWLRGLSILIPASPLTIYLFSQNALLPYFEKLSPLNTLKLCTILIVTIMALIAFIITLRPWLGWDETTGSWNDVFSNTKYCARCKAGKIISPLQTTPPGWCCNVCGKKYYISEEDNQDKQSQGVNYHTK